MMYHNIVVLSQDGKLLFRCNQKKASWYLKKDLAQVVKEEPKTLQLKFQTSGGDKERHPYFVQKFINQCVICGEDGNVGANGKHEHLQHFRIVPGCYNLPKEIVNAMPHFLAYENQLVCKTCFYGSPRIEDGLMFKYQQHQKELASSVGVNFRGFWYIPDADKLMPPMSALVKHGDKIPASRKTVLENQVREVLGYLPTLEGMQHLCQVYHQKGRKPDIKASQLVVQSLIKSIADFDAFCIGWRKFFIQAVQPRYMPQHWDPEFKMAQEFFAGRIR
jgi:hypothetical protein